MYSILIRTISELVRNFDFRCFPPFEEFGKDFRILNILELLHNVKSNVLYPMVPKNITRSHSQYTTLVRFFNFETALVNTYYKKALNKLNKAKLVF